MSPAALTLLKLSDELLLAACRSALAAFGAGEYAKVHRIVRECLSINAQSRMHQSIRTPVVEQATASVEKKVPGLSAQ